MSKRFKDAAEIQSLADQYRNEMTEMRNMIASKNHLANRLRDTEEAWRINNLRGSIEKIEKQISWREARLETLKERMGEINTLQLPTMETEDKSIPA